MPRNKATLSRRQRIRAQESRRRQLTAGGVIIGAVAVVAVLIQMVQPQPITDLEVELPSNISGPVDADGMAWGPKNYRVLVEEFSDFQ